MNGNGNGNGATEVMPPETVTPVRMPGTGTGTPSLISIPPQIATTLVWVAVGFGLAIWLMGRKKGRDY